MFLIDERTKEAVIAFARDVGSSEMESLLSLDEIFENLIREPEAVGFYLEGSESDLNIAFRTVITTLVQCGAIRTYEDKYLNEMPYLILEDERLVNTGAISEDVIGFVEQLSDGEGDNFETLDGIAVGFLEQVEAVAQENGVYYLYVDFSGGDTLFLVPVGPSVYERWLNVEIEEDLAITAIPWALVWDTIATYTFDETSEVEWVAPTLRRLTSISLGK